MNENTAPTPPFVHLRVHSEFSVVDGIGRISALVKKAASFGQPALALTDLSNLFGLIKFYKAARGAGLKPLLGAEILLDGLAGEAPARVLLLVQNHAGYLNLSQLLTLAWTEGVSKGQVVGYVGATGKTIVMVPPP